MPAPAPFSSPHNQPAFPALYLYPLNDTFIPKHIALVNNQRVKIGRQTNAKTVPAERNGYFDSKVLSRQHAEIWEEDGKIYIKDVKSSNGTFINGNRLSLEGVESQPFELKNDDIVEFGIDIIGEDNKTTIHHKVAARVICVFSEEDAQIAARVEQMQSNPAANTVSSQQGPNGVNNSFSFAQGQNGPSQAQRRPTIQSQGLGGLGGSMRPPGKGGLTFDHILSRLQGELQKSRDTGAELHSLSNAMNDIHDTLSGSSPPNPPHYPQNLPPVRQPQPSNQGDVGAPSSDAGSSIPSSALTELRTQLHETQSSLANHVDKVRQLEGMLAEHEAIKSEVANLREMMEERKRDMESHHQSPPRHHSHEDRHGDMRGREYEGDDDDTRSIRTIVPHELERVDEEDEDQLTAEEEDEEDRRRRRDELGRPRTPEPTGMGMAEDDDESLGSKHEKRPVSPLRNEEREITRSSAAIDDLTERLTALATRLESALEFTNSLQTQHSAAQTTISLLESKVASLESLVEVTQAQVQAQTAAQEAAQAQLLEAARQPAQDREKERESLTQMLNEWKKSVEGQWNSVQEEWTQERERLCKAKEEWESKAKSLESGLDAKVSAGVASIVALQNHHYVSNGDAKINGGGGLFTPPSPVSVASDSGRVKPKRRRSSSCRGRSRSRSPFSPIEVTVGHEVLGQSNGSSSAAHRDPSPRQRSRSPSSSLPDDSSEVGELSKGAMQVRYPYTPTSSEYGSPAAAPVPTPVPVPDVTSKTRSKPQFTDVQLAGMSTAVGVLVLSVAAAAVLWRVNQE